MARVLVVDDMGEMRRMVVRALGGDHEIVGAVSDGYAAASEVEETQPDVVVMDHMMPVMDGARAIRQIKTLFPHVLVVGFTSTAESAEALSAAGADAAFLKPDLDGLRVIPQADVDLTARSTGTWT